MLDHQPKRDDNHVDGADDEDGDGADDEDVVQVKRLLLCLGRSD